MERETLNVSLSLFENKIEYYLEMRTFESKIASVLCVCASFTVLLCSASCKQTPCQPETYGPLPTESQLAWADMEYYMFCHFGPNTFSGLQWGHGDENPDIFNPSQMDCEQWVRTAIEAGMKGIIITAKHHDGFCLWPSEYSTHTVAQSSWKDGKGDVLQELRDACDKYDFPMGIYISPWDRNHPTYGTEEYNEIFAKTVDEAHRKYGPFFEQWFDGANGGARIPDYDWPLFYKAVYDNSPRAVIFSDIGPGCRWIGNEDGYAGYPNWNRLNIEGFTPGAGAPANKILNHGEENGAVWIPGECDTPIRRDWFYDDNNVTTLKSVDKLMDIWLNSVGHGANLILNVSPDKRGLLPAEDSLRLMEFKAEREKCFGRELASKTFDFTRKPSCGELTVAAKEPVKFISLQEEIRYGQKIKSFVVEQKNGGEWVEVASGTTVGHKTILDLREKAVTGTIRVRVTDSFAPPMLKSVTLY